MFTPDDRARVARDSRRLERARRNRDWLAHGVFVSADTPVAARHRRRGTGGTDGGHGHPVVEQRVGFEINDLHSIPFTVMASVSMPLCQLLTDRCPSMISWNVVCRDGSCRASAAMRRQGYAWSRDNFAAFQASVLIHHISINFRKEILHQWAVARSKITMFKIDRL